MDPGASGVSSSVTPPPLATRFEIRVEDRYRPFLRLFGVGPDNAFVELTNTHFDARFGRATVRTPLSNIARWRIEAPWRAITAVGFRRSIRHGDITFGGTPWGGVRIDFRERARLGRDRVPALYLTVDDVDGFAAALTERGVPGEDARTRVVETG